MAKVLKALKSIAKVDREIAVRVAEENSSYVVTTLATGSHCGFVGLDIFVATLKAIAPTTLETVLAAVNLTDAEVLWTAKLNGEKSEKKVMLALLRTISSVESPVKDLALRLLTTQ